MSKVLILNGSISEIPIIQKAKAMGHYVVTTGNAPELEGHRYSDEYVPADYSDKDAVLQLVKDHQIEGIISCANDFGVLSAAYVAENMGWKGHDSYQTAQTIHLKENFNDFCEKNDINSPRSKVFFDRESALEYCRNVQYPIIVKATDLTGGKGVLRADDFQEAQTAIENAITRSRRSVFVIEPFLIGRQQSFGVFISNKKVIASYSNDAYSVVNPYLIQYETLPAQGIERYRDTLLSFVDKMIEKLDLSDGILCLQYIVVNDVPYVIESMRRCFGNQFLTLCTANTGFPWEEAYIRASLGEDISDIQMQSPSKPYCGHYGMMTDREGILKSYEIPEDIRKHLFQVIEMIRPGESIKDHMNERVAYLYYQYDSMEEMHREVEKYFERIRIECY